MSALSPKLEAVETYLAHVVDGRTLRDLARADGGPASTQMRRLNRIEDLIEHPEWAAIVDALRVLRQSGGGEFDQARALDRARVAQAFGLSVAQVHRQFASAARVLRLNLSATLVCGDMPMAVVMLDGAPAAKVERKVALAALAFGWIVPICKHEGRARIFAATNGINDATPHESTPAPQSTQPRPHKLRTGRESPIAQLMRRKGQGHMTPEHARLACDFYEIWEMRDFGMQAAFAQIERALPQSVMAILIEACGKQTGFETIEKLFDMPARSAKAVIPLALDSFAHVRRDA